MQKADVLTGHHAGFELPCVLTPVAYMLSPHVRNSLVSARLPLA